MRTRITKITVLLMVLLLAISANIGTKAAAQSRTNAQADIRFVNAIGGLPLRKTLFIDSEIVCMLKNKEQVEVLSKSPSMTQIGMLYDYWYEVKTSDNKTGFVFGGYLEKSIERIDIIQKLEGEYINSKGTYYVTIENRGESWGNLMFRIKTNYPMFDKKLIDVKLADIYSKTLFYKAIDGRGGIDGEILIKFDDEKRLIFYEHTVECDFDDTAEDLIAININETDNTEFLWKTATNLRDKAKIVQSSQDSLLNEKNLAAYKNFTNFLWDKTEFIIENNDLYEFLSTIDYDGEYDYEWSYTYKSNRIMAGNTSFENNVLLEDAPIKIGMTKADVYDLLGVPGRLIRENNKDYIDYFYSMYMEDLYAGDGTFYASTSIGFYFDENDVITKIWLLVEGIEEPVSFWDMP